MDYDVIDADDEYRGFIDIVRRVAGDLAGKKIARSAAAAKLEQALTELTTGGTGHERNTSGAGPGRLSITKGA